MLGGTSDVQSVCGAHHDLQRGSKQWQIRGELAENGDGQAFSIRSPTREGPKERLPRSQTLRFDLSGVHAWAIDLSLCAMMAYRLCIVGGSCTTGYYF